jgi:hypothetical protein
MGSANLIRETEFYKGMTSSSTDSATEENNRKFQPVPLLKTPRFDLTKSQFTWGEA